MLFEPTTTHKQTPNHLVKLACLAKWQTVGSNPIAVT